MQFLPSGDQAADVDGTNNIYPVFDDTALDLQPAAKSRHVRISLNLLDKLMNGVSDMVLARNEVSRHLQKHLGESEMNQAFVRLSSSAAEIRDAVSLMRMQSIDRLFSSLPRLIRDINLELGKNIELHIEGGDVEVDREMVESLRDPLTHIMRNSADHGIESPEERVASGKAPNGNIRVKARQSGNQILIEIADDGRGINLEALRDKAISQQIVTPAALQKMSQREQLVLIFHPGLSTAAQVSSISGRGVGMDVVLTNIQGIGGSIEIDNIPGRGLTLTLRMPLTLSIIAGLSLRAGNQTFGLTRSSVVEILGKNSANVQIENVGGRKIAIIRGVAREYATLESIMGLEESELGAGQARTLIVVRPAKGMQFVLDVEAVIDHEELVVKPGAPLVMASGIYSGTTLPDNGRPMLLLDASGLALAINANAENIADVAESETVTNAEESSGTAVLTFETVDGRVCAIRLAVVERMEEIDAEDLSQSGGKLRANIDGRLIDVFGVKELTSTEKLKSLRISDGTSSICLIVNDVLDMTTIDLDLVQSTEPDLYEGVFLLDGKAIELINPFQFFAGNALQRSVGENGVRCYIECDEKDVWERNMLAPLLKAAGYDVSFDRVDMDDADIVLARELNAMPAVAIDDARVLTIREAIHAHQSSVKDSVYRYDRVGLLTAIEARLAQGKR